LNFHKLVLLSAVLIAWTFFLESKPLLESLDSSSSRAAAKNSIRYLTAPFPADEKSGILSPKKFLLFVIDFDDFMCMTCLDSFLCFCRSLPEVILEEHAWGILLVSGDAGGGGEAGNVLIARKKLRGFVRANRIEFPFLVDEEGMFRVVKPAGSSVFVFDEAGSKIFRYAFPVSKEDARRILAKFQRN